MFLIRFLALLILTPSLVQAGSLELNIQKTSLNFEVNGASETNSYSQDFDLLILTYCHSRNSQIDHCLDYSVNTKSQNNYDIQKYDYRMKYFFSGKSSSSSHSFENGSFSMTSFSNISQFVFASIGYTEISFPFDKGGVVVKSSNSVLSIGGGYGANYYLNDKFALTGAAGLSVGKWGKLTLLPEIKAQVGAIYYFDFYFLLSKCFVLWYNLFMIWTMRNKLLLTFILFPTLFLGIFLLFNVGLLKEDKVAYVLESTLSQAQFMSEKLNTHLVKIRERVNTVVEGYNLKRKRFDRISRSIFDNDKYLNSIIIYDLKMNKVVSSLNKKNYKFNYKPYIDQKLKFIGSDSGLIFRERFSLKGNNTNYLLLADISSSFKAISQMGDSGVFTNFYLVENGNEGQEEKTFEAIIRSKINGKLSSFGGVIEFDKTEYIVGYHRAISSNILSVSYTEMKKVLAAFEDFFIRSILFFIALVGVAFLIGYFVSRRMSDGINLLSKVTYKIGEGDFDLNDKFPYKDEFGVLYTRFKIMAKEIEGLLHKTKENARMENELKNAKIYQSILIPENDFADKNITISGMYRPATECSGDWWFYKYHEKYIYFGIGDVTGHGVSSAMLTTAAKATVESLIDDKVTLDILMKKMNLALFRTTGGRLHMTFFAARFNTETFELEYSNASHDPAVIYRTNQDKIETIFLHSTSCERLASKPDISPVVEIVKLEKNDILFMWTDGITELKNEKGRMFGERKLHKLNLENLGKDENLQLINSRLFSSLDSYTNQINADDITYFLTRFH